MFVLCHPLPIGRTAYAPKSVLFGRFDIFNQVQLLLCAREGKVVGVNVILRLEGNVNYTDCFYPVLRIMCKSTCRKSNSRACIIKEKMYQIQSWITDKDDCSYK